METIRVSRKYSVVYMDAPWNDKDWAQGKTKAVPLQEWIAPEALLLLWIPTPLLSQGLIFMGLWGFDYAGMLAWGKLKDELENPSLYGECEFILIGKAGEVNPSSLLRQNLYETAASPGNYKPQGFRRIFGHAGQVAFGDSATYLDVFGAYWQGKYAEYKKGHWDFLEA